MSRPNQPVIDPGEKESADCNVHESVQGSSEDIFPLVSEVQTGIDGSNQGQKSRSVLRVGQVNNPDQEDASGPEYAGGHCNCFQRESHRSKLLLNWTHPGLIWRDIYNQRRG